MGARNVHNDAYQTDTYRTPGPLGRRTRTFSQFFGGPIGLGSCGITIAFDRRGRLVTTCVTATQVYLRLHATHGRSTRSPSTSCPTVSSRRACTPFEASGGAYFYLDHKDRAVVSIARQIFIVALKDGQLAPSQDLRPERRAARGRAAQLGAARLGGTALVRVAQRRHRGRARSAQRAAARLPAHGGGDRQLLRRGRHRRRVRRHGRRAVPLRRRPPWAATGQLATAATTTSGIQKPGQFDAGSGTTPTLMGRRYLSITDNADPMQVVVLRRDRRLPRGSRRRVCEQPVFEQGASATENSIIATGRSMIVENNYGYAPPPVATEDGNTTVPGVTGWISSRGGRGCRTVWRVARDLAQHGAQAVARQRAGLPLHQAGGHARPLVPHGHRLLHRQDGLAAADRVPAGSSTCTTRGSRSARAACSTAGCWAVLWRWPTAEP